MTPLYKILTQTLLELDLWYAEGVQKQLQNDPRYAEVGLSLSAPISDFKDAVEDYEKGEPMSKENKEIIVKSLEQDRKYTKMLCERLKKEGAVNPFIMLPASHFAGVISEDIQKGIDEIKNLPVRE